MVAELEHQFFDYRASLPTILALEKRESIRAGRETENKLVNTILRIQQTLQSGQALVMRVALAERDNDYGKLEGYAGIVHDAPIDLLDYLTSKEIFRYTEREDSNVLMIEMVIPPNLKTKKFIRPTRMNTTYLCLFPNGADGLVQILMHPSVIREIRIDDIPLNTDTEPQIIFRAVKKTV